MRVLVACEYSGIVRDAFIRVGHEAVSCDILKSESPLGEHWHQDVLSIPRHVLEGFDLMVAHPPCTYLANSGVRWLYEQEGRWEKLRKGAEFFLELMEFPIKRKAVENPIQHKHAVAIIGRRQDQIVQPWQFGHGETKAVGFHLENVPLLLPTNVVEGREARVHRMAPGPERQKERSRFFTGIADAMATQWGGLE